MDKFFLLAFAAALNPTLLTAVTIMLLAPAPKRLLFGYLIGAAMTSITLGLVIVFSLSDSSAVDTTQHTVNPIVNLVFGVIALLIAWALASDRDRAMRERRAEKKAAKDSGEPFWRRLLARGSAKAGFAAGAALTLPGASYIAGLVILADHDPSFVGALGAIIAFNAIMLLLLEAPLVSFLIAPDATFARINRAQDYMGTHGRTFVVRGLTVIGVLLLVRGAITLIA